MPSDLNVIQLVLDASIVVQLVMALLLAASLASWAVILRKRAVIRQARARADNFENTFWSGGDLSALYRAMEGRRGTTTGMETIFEAGFREFGKLRQQSGIGSAQLIEGAQAAREEQGVIHVLLFSGVHHRSHVRDVGARAKARARARQDHCAHVGVVLDFDQRVVEAPQRFAIERVVLLGAIQRERGDTARIGGERDHGVKLS